MTDEPTDDPGVNGTAADADGASGSQRLTAPADGTRAPRLPFPVVGVGASAGGLEAYSELLAAAPADGGLAYVLVQHLPPDRESLIAELLARHTRMPVVQIEDGMPVEPNHVYVIRPGHTLTLTDGKLRLGPPLAARGHGRPVDDFFRSLAAEQQQRAIAVVLSGMGSNGTAGAEAVEAVGGLVIAQDPESAKYPSMPRSLIDANLADFMLRPAEMPEVMVRYAAHPYVATGPADGVPLREEAALAEVLTVLRTRTRHDFAGYRKPTVLRRVQRRMGLGHVATMGEYVKALRQSPGEVAALADDLLIHVTGFFRDPDAWEALREQVIVPLVDDREDGGPIRAWVAACATGEEAYSLAMTLVEAADARGKRFDIKVFATDMAERALGHARSGVFPGGIESEVTPERLERFFDRDDSTYRVKRELRELVIFAPQNVLQDPPFSRLDIVTCRNLLIYLEPDVQRRVLNLLHFGLREGGALLLGNSESVGGEDDFQPIDKKHRLFRRVGPTRHGSLEFHRPPGPGGDRPALVGVKPLGRAAVAQTAARVLLEAFTPAAVAIDAHGQIVYFHGDTGPFLDQPRGEPTRELLALANDQVRGAVRSAVHRAAEGQHAVTVRDGLIETKDGRRRVEVGVTPIDRRPGDAYYLVTFRSHPEPPPPPAAPGDSAGEQRLVEELQRVRDELQSALEEMQTGHEEMKASHEEVTSINEELQSTNEELETSKEELQSLNEELTTVNAQLQAKMGELEATTNDLASLLASTDIAVLFLDPRFRIRRYTPAVKDLLDLIPSDLGRPLADMRRKFADPDLPADAQAVLDKLVPVEREVASESGRVYLRRVLPYRTTDNRIDGVVVTFVDVSERKRAEASLRDNMDELTRFNRAMAGREARMIELKKEVNELLRERASRTATRSRSSRSRGMSNRADLALEAADARAARRAALNALEDAVLARDALKASEERQAFLLKLSDALRAEDGVEAVGNRATRMIAGQLRADRVYLVTLNSEDDKVLVTHESRREDMPPLMGAYRSSDFPSAIKELFERTIVYSDVRSDPRLADAERQALAGLGAVGFIAAPIKRGTETMIWAAGALSTEPRVWTPNEIGLFEDAVERTWAAVGRASAEAELRQSRAFHELVAGLGSDWWFAARVEPDGTVVTEAVSDGFTRLLGYSRDELMAAGGWAAIVHPDDRPAAAAQMARLLAGETIEGELRHVARDGAVTWAQYRTRPEADAGGRVVRVNGVARDVTDRKRAEAAVRESEGRFRGLAEAVPLIVWSSTDDAVDYFNSHWYAYTGLTPDDGLGEAWLAVVHPDDRAEAAERSARSGATGGRYEIEYRLRRHDGAYRWHIARAVRVPSLARWFGTATDVHDLRAALDALRERDEQLSLVQRAAALGVSALDLATGVGVTTPEWRDVVGFPAPPAAPDFATFLALVHPDDRERVAALHAAPPGPDGLEFEFRVRHPARGERWIFSRSRVVPAAGGPGRLVGVALDVTDRKRADEARRASEELARGVAANLPNGAAFVVDHGLRYVLAGGRALAPAGFDPADLEGKTVAEVMPPGLADEYAANYRQALAGEPFRIEHEAHGRHYITHGGPLRDAAGKVTAALAVSYDITDRVRAEEGLRASEERFRLLVENAPDHALFALDPGGRVATWNDAAERLFGYPAGEVVGSPGDVLFTPEDRAAGLPERERQAAARDGRAADENWLLRKDGGRFWASGASAAVRDAAGTLTGFVKVVRDRTEPRAAAERVRRAEEQLRLALSAARMGIWRFDVAADAHTRDANLNVLLGLPPERTRTPFAEFLAHIHPDDRAAVAAGFDQSVRRGRPLNLEFRAVWPDGTVRWLRDQGDTFGRPDDGTLYLTGACADVTELKEAEERLRQANDRLEERVRWRTAELQEAVDELTAERIEREAAEAARQAALGRLVTAEEEERRRVARELHDGLGQYLAAMSIGLVAARQLAVRPDVQEQLDRLIRLSAETGREAHRLALELRPTALDDLGLAVAVRQYVEGWAARTGVPAEFGSRLPDDERFPWQAATAVYRVVQEALTNVLKHARATRASVSLDRVDGHLSVVVEDDGVGFDPDRPAAAAGSPGGLGVRGMRERVALVRGTLDIESTPGGGTTVFVRVPVPEAGHG